MKVYCVYLNAVRSEGIGRERVPVSASWTGESGVGRHWGEANVSERLRWLARMADVVDVQGRDCFVGRAEPHPTFRACAREFVGLPEGLEMRSWETHVTQP